MNKQIEEMAKTICIGAREGCDGCKRIDDCSLRRISERLYNAGYRKASDVAREVVDEINNAIPVKDFNCSEIATGYLWAIADVRRLLLRTKKKYESEGAE